MTQRLRINPNEPGYWVSKDEVDEHSEGRRHSWNNVQLMLIDTSNRLKYLSGDVKTFTRRWIQAKYGPDSPNNVEELYEDLRHEWLPQAVDEGSKAQLLPTIEALYKETETDLQKFAVAIEQAHYDHPIKYGRSFRDIGNDIVQVLENLRQHMHALRIRPNFPVGREIMNAEERRALDRPDSKTIRDYVVLHQLWLYASLRSNIFRELEKHPELKPANVTD